MHTIAHISENGKSLEQNFFCQSYQKTLPNAGEGREKVQAIPIFFTSADSVR